MKLIQKINYLTINNSDVVLFNKGLPKFILSFDNLICNKEDTIRKYFAILIRILIFE
jgi:hypothetical protein